MIKTQSITIKAHQDLIINFIDVLGSDHSMECLVKSHTKLKTPGFLRFLKNICHPGIVRQEWKVEDVEVIDSGAKNLYYKEGEDHPLKDFFLSVNDEDSKVTVVWPTSKQNESCDCLFLFSVVMRENEKLTREKTAVFCQITVKTNKCKGKLEGKINQTFSQGTFNQYYSTMIDNMKNTGTKVKYILIHGDGHINSRADHTKKDSSKTHTVQCYSFWSLGQKEFFDDDAMQKLYELKNNCSCDDCTIDCSCKCKSANKACGEFCHVGKICRYNPQL